MSEILLQLSNDFADQKIYVNLVRNLSERGFKQIVYVPVKKKNKIDGNRDDSIKNVEFIYSFILKTNIFFRLRYFNKIELILNDIESKINISNIRMVHAHFLFSDGGVAYFLKKKYNIPYVVSVRASDVFTFYQKMIHLRSFGNKIMNEADKVIFINQSYKHFFESKYHSILNKSTVIPNAIDDKWFSVNEEKNEKVISNEIRLLYVGRVIKRKKLDIVIKALRKLNNLNYNFCLDVVGDGVYLNKVKKMANDKVVFHGVIKDFDKLKKIYDDCHIFVMPSVKETFGLVYIEALSQGLPIIFCKKEAVDGFFPNGYVGYSVQPNSSNEVVESVIAIIDNYKSMSLNSKKEAVKFNWDEVTKKYNDIYQEVFS